MVTFTWDAASDDATPASALQYNLYLRKAGSSEYFMTVPADPATGFIKDVYKRQFEKCIKEGQAQSVMSAYNAVNGIPCTLNKWLLTDVLRDDWGFDGYVVSDCSAPEYIVSQHHYVDTYEEAASLCIKAGLDLECGDNVYITPLLNAYNRGMVTMSEIDSAAYRVLRGRMRLGLFDDPNENPYNKISPSIVGCEKHRELALEAARQSLVLLKNDKDMLPIQTDNIKSVSYTHL